MLGDDVRALLGDRIPADHAAQVAAEHYIARFHAARREGPGGARIVDLGCGPGSSVDVFRRFDPGVRWLGVDLPSSPERDARARTDAEFADFDGVHLPVEDASVDLVFCKQVLEHVRAPEPLLRDVARALRPGGWLAGSTSQLEPFHSLSLWNYTPHGLTTLIEDAGLRVRELRPCIDGATLLAQRALGMPRFFDRWWTLPSPLNRATDLLAAAAGLDTRQANAIKLLLCGQFCFLAERPMGGVATPAPPPP